MNDSELIKKVNLESAIKCKPIRKLKQILKKYDVDLLNEYYSTITNKEEKDNKANLIDRIYNELTDENVIHNFLSTLRENEYQELVKIINANGEYQDDYFDFKVYCYLEYFGILYTFNYQDKLYIIIPDEIISVFQNMNINQYHQRTIENSKLLDLTYSMLNLYGVVPLDIYLKACCKYYDYKDTKQINLDCLFIPTRLHSIKILRTEKNIYIVKEDCLSYMDDSIISTTISRIEDNLSEFDFKEMTLEEILKYEDLFYYEKNKETNKFSKYLKKHGIKDTELFIGSLILSFRRDYNEGIISIKDCFEEDNMEINKDNFEEIMTYINHIIDNIPCWGNKGWANKEIILGKCYE